MLDALYLARCTVDTEHRLSFPAEVISSETRDHSACELGFVSTHTGWQNLLEFHREQTLQAAAAGCMPLHRSHNLHALSRCATQWPTPL